MKLFCVCNAGASETKTVELCDATGNAVSKVKTDWERKIAKFVETKLRKNLIDSIRHILWNAREDYKSGTDKISIENAVST